MQPRVGRRIAALALLVTFLGACAAAPDAPPDVPAALVELVDDLRAGGHVLFLRHAATDQTIPSGGDDHNADCAHQRNLSTAGRADAEVLGATLRDLGVPIGPVLASPYCRTLDTARLAFGTVVADERLLPDPEAGPLLGALLAPPQVGNRVLVGHASTLADLLDVHLEEGEAAVFTAGADGVPHLVGRLSTAALQPE